MPRSPFDRPQHWDKLAGQYADSLFFLNYGSAPRSGRVRFSWLKPEHRIYRYWVHLLLAVLGRTSLRGKRVLDVGCGRGGHCRIMAEYLGASRVVGVDFSKESIQFCKRKHRFRNLRFVQADAHRLPFPDGSFDVVLNVASSSMYRDRPRFYGEVRRVLRPGGIFCYSDAIEAGSEGSCLASLEKAGFKVIQARNRTRNVVSGIVHNNHQVKKLIFRSGVQKDPVINAVNTIYGTNVMGLKKLRSGYLRFYSWKAKAIGPGDEG